MCEKCVELDEKISRFKRIIERFIDQRTIDGLTAAIAELQAKKAELHPENKE